MQEFTLKCGNKVGYVWKKSTEDANDNSSHNCFVIGKLRQRVPPLKSGSTMENYLHISHFK